jgi:hypothetical protein
MEQTIVYKKGGPHRGPYGTTYTSKGVSDESVFKELTDGEWYDNLDEAVNPVEEMRRQEKKDGDKLILGRSKVRRKEDYVEKPKVKAKAKAPTLKQKTKAVIDAKAKEDK